MFKTYIGIIYPRVWKKKKICCCCCRIGEKERREYKQAGGRCSIGAPVRNAASIEQRDVG